MRTVRVERTIEAPLERVFEILTDHAGYKRFRGIRDSKLVREGRSEPNGTGALRKVDVGPVHFEEEITAYERPTRMDYLIRKVNMPLEHQGGSIRCDRAGGGTHVVWSSTFGATVPAIGGLVSRVTALSVRLGFHSVLRDADRLLTEGDPAIA